MRTPSKTLAPIPTSNGQHAAALVHLAGQDVITDSRIVAKAFGKQHFHVLRDIRAILTSIPAEFAESNFGFCREISTLQNGKRQTFYRLTKDAFLLLVMGFTGAQAMAVKIAFIDAFNRMAEFIRGQAAGAWEAFNRAYQQHLADRRHVSACGRDMRRWQDVKPQQLELLDQLHPQIPIAFPAVRGLGKAA